MTDLPNYRSEMGGLSFRIREIAACVFFAVVAAVPVLFVWALVFFYFALIAS